MIMEKVVLNRESVRSIMDMYASTDNSNQLVANEIINNCDIEKSLPWLVLIYAEFSRINDYWVDNMPNALKAVEKLQVYGEYKPTINSVLMTLLDLKAETDVVDLFLQLHVETLKRSMKNWGYPVDKLNFSITLKDDKE
jgi:hypothetical protein